jgi:microcystin-dependent protein
MKHHFRPSRAACTLGTALVLILLAGGVSPLHAQATDPYLGQIVLVAFNYAPSGWAECNGQLLSIAQNQALYSLLGTRYGGDGVTTFALPDLRGRVPVHAYSQISLGQKGGEETHTLTQSEIPAHGHGVEVSSVAGTSVLPTGAVPARSSDLSNNYGKSANASMNAAAVTTSGSSQAHENRMPYKSMKYIIALQGIYPFRP